MDSGHAITKRSYDYHSDELQWVIQIRQSLQHEIEEEEENNLISIPAVPKPLQCGSLAAYIPQTIAIGPYHQLRAELNDMARCKLSAAKRIRQQLRVENFRISSMHSSQLSTKFALITKGFVLLYVVG
ncbi:hypothetical protein HPP92_010014 [Vanilla planifolia]|uniref:Uncharacterized protein n=1 Tax=Vanilla planifolia TaxID=51239 RepID=A0A835V6V4_VANPL|nr:hypothetical protein HPP92_010014 [Vanilla planifolia]